jgi:molybdopterin converting factor small subunit
VTLRIRAGALAADVWDALTPPVRAMRAQCALAVNDAWADDARVLADGDVVDVIPPVSGG